MNDDGRNHYSPSAVAMWADEPALRIIWKRFRVRGDMGVATWLGDAVHQAVAFGLLHGQRFTERADLLAACTQEAGRVLIARAQGELSLELDAARARMPEMIRQALMALLPLGQPLGSEMRVQASVPGTNAVLHGRTDFTYEFECIDLKTSTRAQTKANSDQLAALAFYREATGKAQRLLYATEAKFSWIAPPAEDLDLAWSQLCRHVAALERFDAMPTSELLALFPPRDLSGFRWDETTRRKAAELWNLNLAA